MTCCCIQFRPKSILGYCICGLSLSSTERRIISRLVLKLSFMYGFVDEKHALLVRYILELYGKKLVLEKEDLSSCSNHVRCKSHGGFCICLYGKTIATGCALVTYEFVRLLQETTNTDQIKSINKIGTFIERHKTQLFGELPVFDECRHHSPCFGWSLSFQNNLVVA